MKPLKPTKAQISTKNNIMNTTSDTSDIHENPQPVSDINYDNAYHVLVEELNRIGVYSSNDTVKTCIHVLGGKLYGLMNKVDYARTILDQPL